MVFCLLALLLTSAVSGQNEPEYIQRILGTTDLQIGFVEDCYLYWKGVSGDRKPGEFRCGTRKGNNMEVIAVGNDSYKFKSDGRHMYWLGQNGDVKPMQFRTGPGDTFWIRDQGEGMFAIGHFYGPRECPLYWLGQRGNTKPAEFRCGREISDTFWIKGHDCKAIIIEPIGDDENQATYDGEEIVGVAASGTCSNTSYQTLILGRTDEVSEEIGIELEKSNSSTFEFGASISVTGEVGLFGTGVETTATASFSVGNTVGFSSTNTKSTSMTTSNSAGSETHYNTPGAAFVVGYTKRYVLDKSNVPAKVTVECGNGYQFQHNTTIKLRSRVFGSTFFETAAVQFRDGKCEQQYLDCIRARNFRNYVGVTNAKQAFLDCFPPDTLIKKKKKKAKKVQSSEKSSENKQE